jgi:hypothetical protein
VSEQGTWRRTNQQLRELDKAQEIAADIKKERLESLGHLARLNHGRTVKKISESKLEGRKRVGRSRLRWLKMLRRI